ncbi:MAG: hypothetical protein SPI53_05490 [Erysipelotrichaceae bacterium]|nr:hypothetical protein [Erysipelotrichaceae bacterium]
MRWQTKNEEKKEFKASFGSTDYNIPTITYKGAFIIAIGSFLVMLVVMPILDALFKVKYPGIIVSSMMIAWIISYVQHFISSKKGFGKSFWTVFTIFTLVVGVILFLTIYGNFIP